MDDSGRQRRIEAARDALQLKVAEHAMKGIDDWNALAEAALDAADRAEPSDSADTIECGECGRQILR